MEEGVDPNEEEVNQDLGQKHGVDPSAVGRLYKAGANTMWRAGVSEKDVEEISRKIALGMKLSKKEKKALKKFEDKKRGKKPKSKAQSS
jgi:hypothetical protein